MLVDIQRMAAWQKLMILGCAAGGCLSLNAQFTFTRLVDSGTPIPAGSGSFSLLRSAVFNGGSVAFVGEGAGQQGVYAIKEGTLTRVADRNTPIPNASGNFTNFTTFAYAVDGDKIAFFGAGVGVTGLYLSENGVLTRAIDSTAVVPERGENFGVFGGVALAGGKLAFSGGAGSYRGQYVLDSGGLTRFYDNQTRYPGQDVNMFFSAELAYGDGRIAGWVNSGQLAAIVSSDANSVSLVADKTDTPPGQTTPFTGFQSPPVIADGKVIFFGSYSGGNGIYSADFAGNTVTRLVDRSMTAPDVGALFGALQSFSYNEGTLAFVSVIDGMSRLYILQNGQFTLVLAGGTELDSKVLTFIGVSRKAIGNGELVFSVAFADNSSAIYKTTIGRGSSSAPVIDLQSITYSQGGFGFAFEGQAGKQYEIQFKNGLNTDSWHLLTNFTFSSRAQIIDTNASGSSRYYRGVEK